MVETATASPPRGELTPRVVKRWREKLGAEYPRAAIDAFVRRYQATLDTMVARELVRRAETGRTPTGVHAFAAYASVVQRERRVDALPDDQLLERLSALIQADFATGRYREQSVLDNFGREYVLARGEAMFLRLRGWDAVPLMVDAPALAIAVNTGEVIAVRTHMGQLVIHPARRGTLNHLYADVRKSEEDIEAILEELTLETNTKERLIQFAYALWEAARTRIAPLQGRKRSAP
ncbi:MAG: hypothetical protein JNL82_32120 [Myxococcales bacterium]|nr:hypothetical protein [Myxococcales bacterium]